MSSSFLTSDEQVNKVRADVKRILIKFYKDLAYVAPELYGEKFQMLAASIDAEIVTLQGNRE